MMMRLRNTAHYQYSLVSCTHETLGCLLECLDGECTAPCERELAHEKDGGESHVREEHVKYLPVLSTELGTLGPN